MPSPEACGSRISSRRHRMPASVRVTTIRTGPRGVRTVSTALSRVRRAAVWRATTEAALGRSRAKAWATWPRVVSPMRARAAALCARIVPSPPLSTTGAGSSRIMRIARSSACAARRPDSALRHARRMAAPKQPPLIALRTKVASAPARKSAASPASSPTLPSRIGCTLGFRGRNGAMAAGSARSLIAFALPFHAPSTSHRTPRNPARPKNPGRSDDASGTSRHRSCPEIIKRSLKCLKPP
jgi:hypothetical protein